MTVLAMAPATDGELATALEQLGTVRGELWNTRETVCHLEAALVGRYALGREAGWWQAMRFVVARLRAEAARHGDPVATVLLAAARHFEKEGYSP